MCTTVIQFLHLSVLQIIMCLSKLIDTNENRNEFIIENQT